MEQKLPTVQWNETRLDPQFPISKRASGCGFSCSGLNRLFFLLVED